MVRQLTLIFGAILSSQTSYGNNTCSFIIRADGKPDVTLFGTTYSSEYVPTSAASTGDSNDWKEAPMNYQSKDCAFSYCYARVSCKNAEKIIACFPTPAGECPDASLCNKDYERNIKNGRFSLARIPKGTKVERKLSQCSTGNKSNRLMIRPSEDFVNRCKTVNIQKWSGEEKKYVPEAETTSLEPIACVFSNVPCKSQTTIHEADHPKEGPKVDIERTRHCLSMYDPAASKSANCPSLHACFMIVDGFRNSDEDPTHFTLKLQGIDQSSSGDPSPGEEKNDYSK